MKLNQTNQYSELFIPYHKIFLVSFFTIFILSLHAQKIAEPKFFDCSSIDQEDGLVQLNVKCLAQDELGYLWLGTEDGLLRYNGYEFKAFLHDPKDHSSIKDDHIRGMLYSEGKLWLATNSEGICYYTPQENKFHDFTLKSQDAELNTSYKILSLVNDTLVFSVKNNLILVNQSNEQSSQFRLPVSNRECIVNDVIHLNGDKYWLATSSAGILEMDTPERKLLETGLLKSNTNNCFYQLGDELFIGTEEGLFFYDLKKKQLNETTFNKPVNCFYTIDDHSFYMGTDVGLFTYNRPENTITPLIIKTQNNVLQAQLDINQILGDEKGNLWIGTEGDGLFHYNIYQKKFNAIKLQLDEFPQTTNISTFQFLPEGDSTLWLGTKYGVAKYSQETGKFKFYDSVYKPLIYTIKKDENNTIWAGGFTSGLIKYNSVHNDFESVNANLPDNDVVEIIPFDRDHLWICTWAGGIHEFNIQSGSTKEILVQRERINRARTSLIDSKGNIWLGTDQGAYKIAVSGEVTHYTENAQSELKLSGDRIFSIAEDKEGNIWFGTNVGLTKLDPVKDKTTVYYKQKGLPNDFIYSVLVAPNNDVWVSTNLGISVLRNSTNSFTNFTRNDGLQNNEFNGKAGFQDEKGNFYFGGISGFNIFNPMKIIENPFHPKVYIESVELFNAPINSNELFADNISFEHNENVLTFNFAALNFLNPEKCSYTYKMEGFDDDWRPVTKNRTTTYTNLDPGDYTFLVKATNDAGIWSEFTDELHLTIIPPWYASTWSRLTFIAVFLLSGIGFYYYQTRKLKREKAQLELMVSHRTKQVLQKNIQLQGAFREAASQRDHVKFLMKEMRHRINNNLQIISSLLSIQAAKLESEKAIDVIQMAKNRILAIAQVESKIKNESEDISIGSFIRDISESIIQALSAEDSLKFKTVYHISDQKIKNINTILLGLILNELITNVTKYAFVKFDAENTLTINCNVNENKLILSVSDNGTGYEPSGIRTNSMGLSLVRNMVKQLNGSLKIDSTNGTTNNIEIPI